MNRCIYIDDELDRQMRERRHINWSDVAREAFRKRLDSEPSSEFKPGDVVRLKSGGPAMTVGSQECNVLSKFTDKFCFVQWFDGDTLNEAVLQLDSLRHVEELNRLEGL